MTRLMIKNKELKNRAQRGYKLFKSHKGWLIAPLAALGLVTVGATNIGHADTSQESVNTAVNQQTAHHNANIVANSQPTKTNSVIPATDGMATISAQSSNNSSSSNDESNSNNSVVMSWTSKKSNLQNMANVDVQYQETPGKMVAPVQELNTTTGRIAKINSSGVVTANGQSTQVPKGYMVVKAPVGEEKVSRGFNPAVVPVQKKTNVLHDFGATLTHMVGDPSPTGSPGNVPSGNAKKKGKQSKDNGSNASQNNGSSSNQSGSSSQATFNFKWPGTMAFVPGGPLPGLVKDFGDYHQSIRSKKKFKGVKDPNPLGKIVAFCRDPNERTPYGAVETKADGASKFWNVLVAGFPYYGLSQKKDTPYGEESVQNDVWHVLGKGPGPVTPLGRKIWEEASKAHGRLPAPKNTNGFTIQDYDYGSSAQSVVAVAWSSSGNSNSTSTNGGGHSSGGGCGGTAAAGAAGGAGAAAGAAGGGAAGGAGAAAGAGGATNGTAGGVAGGGNGNNNSTPTGPNNNDVIPAGSVTTSNNNPSNNNIVPEVPMVNNNDVTNNYPQKVDDHVGVLTALAALVSQESKSENLELANLQDKNMDYDLGRGQTRDNWIQNIQVNMAQRDGSLAAKINSAAVTASNGSAIQSFAYSAGMQSMQNSLKNSQELQSVKDRLASAQANQSANQTNASTDTDNDNNEMPENNGTTQDNDDFNQDLQNDFQQIPDQNANGNQTQSNSQAQPTPVQNLSNNGSGQSSFNPGSNILGQLNQALEGITGGNNSSQNNDNGDGSNVMSQLNNLLNGITS